MTALRMIVLAAGLLAACSPTVSGTRPGGVTVLATAPGAFDVTVLTPDPERSAADARAAVAGSCPDGRVEETGRVTFSTSHRAFSLRCAGPVPASRTVAPGTLAGYRLLAEQDIGQGEPCGDGSPTPRRLRALAAPDGGRTVHQLAVADCHRGIAARQWNGAAVGNAPLPFMALEQSTVSCAAIPLAGCERREVFAALLRESDLRDAAANGGPAGAGLPVAFSAANGAVLTIGLPAEAIRRHLSAIGG